MATATPRPVLHHVNLKTSRMQEMIDWYTSMVGLEITHQADGAAWTTNDAANHRIALLATPDTVDDPDKLKHAGLHHIAFEYASVPDLVNDYVRIRDEVGSTLHMALDHGMTLSFYFVDPDGNSLELQADWFGDWSESKDFMLNSPEFEADPIGTFVDPDKIAEALADGASVEELHTRGYAGEFAPAEKPNMRLP